MTGHSRANRVVHNGLAYAEDFAPASQWHEHALRGAGFSEVGLVWRGLRDAAIAGVR